MAMQFPYTLRKFNSSLLTIDRVSDLPKDGDFS